MDDRFLDVTSRLLDLKKAVDLAWWTGEQDQPHVIAWEQELTQLRQLYELGVYKLPLF
jgi:hypothetical protein